MCATEDLTPAELATAADLDYVLEREPQLGDGKANIDITYCPQYNPSVVKASHGGPGRRIVEVNS